MGVRSSLMNGFYMELEFFYYICFMPYLTNKKTRKDIDTILEKYNPFNQEWEQIHSQKREKE